MDSRHFVLDEFADHTGAPFPPEVLRNLSKLMAMLDDIREAWQGPITVVSGYRSPELNAALVEASKKRNGGVSGVATDSQHCKGAAADIRPHQPTPERVMRLYGCIKAAYGRGELPTLGGLGRYPGWVHCDVRERVNGHLAQWTGTGMGQST